MQNKEHETHQYAAWEGSDSTISLIDANYLADEESLVESLLAEIQSDPKSQQQTQQLARQLIGAVRKNQLQSGGLQALLEHYDLSTQEGVVLMCLAEALLRIPDKATVDALIADKLKSANWQQHLGQSDSLFVNASTWALMLSGRLLQQNELSEGFIDKLLSRLEGPVLRSAIQHAMRMLAEQFVMGPDIKQALARAEEPVNRAYLYSYDMLGEAALTSEDAQCYQLAYLNAIDHIGEQVDSAAPILQRPSIS
ncbi:MAG: bifunctional proline dehydrogenase/L-glutamate gamma-semialdehyde dehydrogenase PutA, partial [Pseudomonadales bacterium]